MAAPTISQLMAARLTRRTALKGAAAAGVYGLFGCATPAPQVARSTLTFTESGRYLDETHHVATGYQTRPMLRWGDPLHADAPAFNPPQQTAAAQERQFGANNDYVAFMPLPRGSNSSTRGLRCVNHEYVSPSLMCPGFDAADYAKNITREQCETEMAAIGHSVVEVELRGGQRAVNAGRAYNRRISTRSTPMRISGPAAGHPRMAKRADVSGTRVIGTMSNCAGGTTPWGTVLTAEENIQNFLPAMHPRDAKPPLGNAWALPDAGAIYGAAFSTASI